MARPEARRGMAKAMQTDSKSEGFFGSLVHRGTNGVAFGLELDAGFFELFFLGVAASTRKTRQRPS
jgi:hypothetical protein